jgi:hypothetical protein
LAAGAAEAEARNCPGAKDDGAVVLPLAGLLSSNADAWPSDYTQPAPVGSRTG